MKHLRVLLELLFIYLFTIYVYKGFAWMYVHHTHAWCLEMS